MPKTVFDTRFFIEHYYSHDGDVLRRTKEEIRKTKERYISAIVIHEVYQLTLEREGRQTAILRTSLLEKDFRTVNVDSNIAKSSAELRHKYKTSMADSVVAATSLFLNAICISDDPHLKVIREIKSRWI